jgi:hypothetical protein
MGAIAEPAMAAAPAAAELVHPGWQLKELWAGGIGVRHGATHRSVLGAEINEKSAFAWGKRACWGGFSANS